MENTAKVWLTPSDLHKRFGISTSTQNKLRMKKAILYSKIGQKIFYDSAKIDKWIEDAEVA